MIKKANSTDRVEEKLMKRRTQPIQEYTLKALV